MAADVHVQLRLSNGRLYTFISRYFPGQSRSHDPQLIDSVRQLLTEGYSGAIGGNPLLRYEIPACLQDHILVVGPLTDNSDGSYGMLVCGVATDEQLSRDEVQNRLMELLKESDPQMTISTTPYDGSDTMAPMAHEPFPTPTQASDSDLSGSGATLYDKLGVLDYDKGVCVRACVSHTFCLHKEIHIHMWVGPRE